MVVLCSAMKAVERQKSHPKKIEVGHCYLAMESTNVSLVLYRVCVVAAIATASEQYEVPYIYMTYIWLLSWLLTIMIGLLH